MSSDITVFEDREMYVWQKALRSTLIEVVPILSDGKGETRYQIWMNGKAGFGGMAFNNSTLDARLAFFTRVDALRALEVEDVDLIAPQWLHREPVAAATGEDQKG